MDSSEKMSEQTLEAVSALLIKGLERLQRTLPTQRQLGMESEQLFSRNPERELASGSAESVDTGLLRQ
jgi:hypothetical protein